MTTIVYKNHKLYSDTKGTILGDLFYPHVDTLDSKTLKCCLDTEMYKVEDDHLKFNLDNGKISTITNGLVLPNGEPVIAYAFAGCFNINYILNYYLAEGYNGDALFTKISEEIIEQREENDWVSFNLILVTDRGAYLYLNQGEYGFDKYQLIFVGKDENVALCYGSGLAAMRGYEDEADIMTDITNKGILHPFTTRENLVSIYLQASMLDEYTNDDIRVLDCNTLTRSKFNLN